MSYFSEVLFDIPLKQFFSKIVIYPQLLGPPSPSFSSHLLNFARYVVSRIPLHSMLFSFTICFTWKITRKTKKTICYPFSVALKQSCNKPRGATVKSNRNTVSQKVCFFSDSHYVKRFLNLNSIAFAYISNFPQTHLEPRLTSTIELPKIIDDWFQRGLIAETYRNFALLTQKPEKFEGFSCFVLCLLKFVHKFHLLFSI